MRIDPKLASLLSGFFLDVSKASFIGTFITPYFSNLPTYFDLFTVLTKGLIGAILALIIAWLFAKLAEEK